MKQKIKVTIMTYRKKKKSLKFNVIHQFFYVLNLSLAKMNVPTNKQTISIEYFFFCFSRKF